MKPCNKSSPYQLYIWFFPLIRDKKIKILRFPFPFGERIFCLGERKVVRQEPLSAAAPTWEMAPSISWEVGKTAAAVAEPSDSLVCALPLLPQQPQRSRVVECQSQFGVGAEWMDWLTCAATDVVLSCVLCRARCGTPRCWARAVTRARPPALLHQRPPQNCRRRWPPPTKRHPCAPSGEPASRTRR